MAYCFFMVDFVLGRATVLKEKTRYSHPMTIDRLK